MMQILRLDLAEAAVSPAAPGRLVGPTGERAAAWAVPEETPVAVLLNGESFAVMMATPSDLEDFCVGFALTEGLIDQASDLRELRLAEAADGIVANLVLDPARVAAVEDRRRTLAGRAGCGICGAQTISAALPRPPKVRGRVPEAAAVLAAFAAFPGAQRMRAENRSTHAAGYCAWDGTVELVREDLGRHNALDKLAGALAREGRDASAGFVILSSRVGVEMVQKACTMRAPFLAAVSAPSALALRVAGQAGLRVAGLAGEALMIFDPADACATETPE